MSRVILTVGLTGGIASGKSTVAKRFALRGAFTIDADRIAHQAIEPDGPAHADVVKHFGDRILDTDGKIVRARLGAIVFADRRRLDELNAIVHPRVREESKRLIRACVDQGRHPMAVYDAALLIETGIYKEFDRLVVVACSRERQIERLRERDGMDVEQAESRIDAQAPLSEKVALADYVIETNGTVDQTLERADEVYAALLETRTD